MITPGAAGAASVLPQAIAARLTRAAIFLVVTLNPGPDQRLVVRSLCADFSALLRAVGFREQEGGLSCIMGFGSEAWDRLFGSPRPAQLHPFREIRAGPRHAVATPGDLLFHIRANRMDLCFELATQIMARLGGAVSPVDEVHGFRYFDARDLLGFVDGTENPIGQEAIDATLIGEEDADFAGGSYVIVQKYLHDMTTWNALSTEEQERIIGRTKLTDIELDDAIKPTSAHAALTTIVDNGEEKKILRDNMPFGRAGRGRVRHLFHRLQPVAAHDRTDARKHVYRPPAGQLRPAARFQQGRHRQPVFRADRDISRPGDGRGNAIARSRTRSAPPAARRRFARHRFPKRRSPGMNNLHRELAPISEAAWSQIEEEAARTLKRYLAGRRVVDMQGPVGTALSAIGTGHLQNIAAPDDGIIARQRAVKALVELRVPFELDRQAIDDVERGANDSDWQPAKDAARRIAFAEDRAIFEGYPAAGIEGIRSGTSNPVMTLPAEARTYPKAVAQAMSQLRLVGVDGPYSVLLGADAYTALAETVDQGYPVLQHIRRLVDSEIIWAPAIAGGFVLSTRGGDFDLHVGQDFSIGYSSHTATAVSLYLQETFTFLLLTSEAAVALTPAGTAQTR